MSRHPLPEASRVVHVHRMHQLMNEEIAHHRRALKQETAIQADGAASRAASPAGALAADERPLELKPELSRALLQRRRQHLARSLHQPAAQLMAHDVLIIRIISVEGEQARPQHRQPCTTCSASVMNTPALITSRQLNPRRWERSIGYRFLSRLMAFTLDPIAVTLEKMFNRTRRGSCRHNHFNATGVEHTYGQAP